MRITFLGQNSPDKFSGGRYHAWMMAEAAAYMGHDVDFVTDHKPIFYDDFADFPRHSNVNIHLRPVLQQTGWDLPDHACDVLVVVPHTGSRTPYFYIRARLFAARKRARLVMINFESPNWFNALAPEPRDVAQWDGWKLCSEGASMILSISAEGDKYAREFYDTCPRHTLFTYCHPPINSIVADSVLGVPREKRIVMLGRFDQASHKGIASIPDLLCEEMRGYTLVLVSGIGMAQDSFMRQLTARAERYGVTIEIRYQISDREKYRELKRAVLLLFPSFFEGFGLPPVEAQYCNVPCVAYDLPVLREVSGDAIDYVPAGDVKAFRKKIGEVLAKGARENELKSGISPVARFEHYSTRVDKVLRQALHEGKVRSTRGMAGVGEQIKLRSKMVALIPRALAGSTKNALRSISSGPSAKKQYLVKSNGTGAANIETGTVVWFNEEKRFGFVRATQGGRILFVHTSFLEGSKSIELKVGSEVEYESVDGSKGLEARSLRLAMKYGFSVCAFDTSTSSFQAKGWLLGAQIASIELHLNGKRSLGRAKTGTGRPDVYRDYPQYGDRNCGWTLSCKADRVLGAGDTVEAQIRLKDGRVQTMSRPVRLTDSRDQAVEALAKLPNTAVFRQKPVVDVDAILSELERLKIPVERRTVDFKAYSNWYREVDYPRNYPRYVDEFPVEGTLSQKAMQHYLSIELMGLSEGRTYMDVASSNSVFPDIALKHIGVTKAYRQDLKYTPGVHGDKVGGNGASIPLPDETLDAMALHCSWEHFEGDSDVGLLQEAVRLLRTGGRVCIVPLYMANEHLIQTSLSMWRNGAKLDVPIFELDATLYIREDVHQRCMRSYDPVALRRRIFANTPSDLRLCVHHFTNWTDREGCPVFALTGEKI
ncbi:MAG: cold shock domain-containing protein [Candidatus Hydrogenedentes bacterium]|nr:cold shock domain-containing protein [Candidatus Hydrogenedentota bacterium]